MKFSWLCANDSLRKDSIKSQGVQLQDSSDLNDDDEHYAAGGISTDCFNPTKK
jgi:hypothetical protein